MKRYRLAFVLCTSAVLLGGLLTSAAPVLATDTVQDQAKGSLLVFPIFDVIGANRTKIEITNRGAAQVTARVAYVCQAKDPSTVCNTITEDWDLAFNQTIILDVGDRVGVACATGQGFIVVWAELPCSAGSPGGTCPTATGGTVPDGEFGPIAYNQLYGSYNVYYNGAANPVTDLCGGIPCSPTPVGPFPDVAAANAIAFESQQPMYSFLGSGTGAQLNVTFGTTTAFDYVAFPAGVQAGFAAPGAALIAGPSTHSPFIPPDTVSGTELQTNIILLNMNLNVLVSSTPAATSVTAWNWFTTTFKSTNSFLCWERVPINTIDARLTAAGPFAANYGQVRFVPALSAGNSNILGAIEQVSTVGRTIRSLIHNGTAPNPATFTSPR